MTRHTAVLGLLIGAILTQFASWSWVFWFGTILILPISAICMIMIPTEIAVEDSEEESKVEKAKGLDLVGVGVLTAALILFIFAVTSGSTDGWGTAIVLAPLIISVAMVGGFFWYETRIPESRAAL